MRRHPFCKYVRACRSFGLPRSSVTVRMTLPFFSPFVLGRVGGIGGRGALVVVALCWPVRALGGDPAREAILLPPARRVCKPRSFVRWSARVAEVSAVSLRTATSTSDGLTDGCRVMSTLSTTDLRSRTDGAHPRRVTGRHTSVGQLQCGPLRIAERGHATPSRLIGVAGDFKSF